MLRTARIAVPVALVALLAALVVRPASAQETTTVTYAGPVTAGETLELRCPSGYQIDPAGNATASFYRNDKLRGEVAVNVGPTSMIASENGTVIGASWLVPRGARYATAELTCQPTTPTTQTYTFTGVAETAVVTVDCPPERPYLAWVYEVLGDADGDLSTSQGQSLLGYATTPTGVRFGIGIGWAYRVVLECSAVPQST